VISSSAGVHENMDRLSPFVLSSLREMALRRTAITLAINVSCPRAGLCLSVSKRVRTNIGEVRDATLLKRVANLIVQLRRQRKT
jgi:hypothetical protein